MGLPLRDSRHHTYGDYLHWPEDVRYELIDGEAYLMAPAPTATHQRLVGELFRQIADALEDRDCEVFIAPFDVRLPRADEEDEAIDTVVQPDLTVVCDPGKIDERGCRGAPDWVIEVLSPSTAAHDQTRKLAAYERAGVRECWLVHPGDRTVMVYTIADEAIASRAYGRPAISELVGTLDSSAVDGVRVDWSRVLRERAAGSGD